MNLLDDYYVRMRALMESSDAVRPMLEGFCIGDEQSMAQLRTVIRALTQVLGDVVWNSPLTEQGLN